MTLPNTSTAFADAVRAALAATECDGEFSLKGPVYLVGNGGSAAICSHIATDLLKRGSAAILLTDPAVLTAFSNDYGYRHAYAYQLHRHATRGTLIAISSSGESENIQNAALYAANSGFHVITLSGFSAINPLRSKGHVNYYVPSHNYGVVEIAHLTILHSLINPG